jgi:hypothetical protein
MTNENISYVSIHSINKDEDNERQYSSITIYGFYIIARFAINQIYHNINMLVRIS